MKLHISENLYDKELKAEQQKVSNRIGGNIMKKRILSVVLAIAAVCSMTACGGGSGSTSTTNEKGEIEELVQAVQPESGEYDPAGAAAYQYFSVQTQCYEGFVSYDEKGKIQPAAAEKWDVNEDATEYTFYIRSDEKWSDGSDVTSADFENTMKRALEPENGSWYVDFLFVIKNAKACFDGECSFDEVGIECIDEKTIKFTLEEPCAYFLDLCKLPVYMPSNCKYATDDNPDWDMNPEQNLGNGPYHLAEHVDGDYVAYEKNEYYRDADKVTVLRIVDKFMDDNQAKSSAYQTGEINILSGAPNEIAEAYEGTEDMRFREIPQTNYILFNINEAPFDDVRVRQAFALALNRTDIAAVVGKSCEPGTTFVGKNFLSKATGEKWSELQGELLEENLEKAKELLKEAGYENGEGLPEITYTYPAMNYEADVAQVLQAQWKELGVDVKLEAMEYEVYVSERRSGNLQLARHQWYADYNDPTSWLKMYETGNAQNDINWSNEEYDTLLAESDKELDEAKREEQLMAAERILVTDETVICPLFSNSNIDLIDPTLTGYFTDGLGYTFWQNTTKKE